MREHRRSVWRLLTPSWLSGLICVLLAGVLLGSVVGLQWYHGSTLQQQVIAWRSPSSPGAAYLTAFGEQGSDTRLQSALAGLTTGLVWACLALLVYGMGFVAYDALQTARRFRRQLRYVHVRPALLIRDVSGRVILRLITLGVWGAYMVVFFRTVVPYVLMAAHVAAVDVLSAAGLAYVLGAAVVLVSALHLHVVLLRFLLLRARVFTG